MAQFNAGHVGLRVTLRPTVDKTLQTLLLMSNQERPETILDPTTRTNRPIIRETTEAAASDGA